MGVTVTLERYGYRTKNLAQRHKGSKRMEEEQMPQRILYAKISGNRKVRRPKSRRLDEVNEGARKEGKRMWWWRALGGER